MITQVIFKIDKKLKEKAMAKAQHEGIAFASVLKLATKAFVDGDLTLELVGSEKFNTKTAREIKGALNDISQDKNLSRGFTSAKDAIKFLKA
ncbi:MAG: hypothetical protein WCT54_04530 [Patescibacteria group bacterium]|jgi:antitoxin component of RelBE/YafQ-DinJ toxin-antitoxin module